MGLFVNPSLKCILLGDNVSSPTTHHNLLLFNFSSYFVVLVEVPCLSPLEESQCFLWSLFVHSLAALLATPTDMPQTMNGHSHPNLAN
jgi:hypothetical protein